MSKREKALDRAREKADALGASVSLPEILNMGRAPDIPTRLLSLLLARKRIELGDSPGEYLGLARSLVADPDNNCRWQALIVVGENIKSDPEAVFEVVKEFGDSPHEDMRTGVACVLLEHLLEADFETYFQRLRELIRQGRTRFADCLSTCWFDEPDGPNRRRVQRLVRNTKRGLPRSQQTG